MRFALFRPLPGRTPAGSTATEMALILPVLLLMLFGTIDLANMLRIQVTLNSAVTNLAREIALDSTVRTQTAASEYMTTNNLLPSVTQTDSRATVPVLTLTKPKDSSGKEYLSCTSSECDPFELSISYTYYAITPLTKPFFDGIVLSASVKKTAEPGT